jgi:hypothetical protein
MTASDTGKFGLVKGLFGGELRTLRECGEQSSPGVHRRPFDQGDGVVSEVVGHIRIGLELV